MLLCHNKLLAIDSSDMLGSCSVQAPVWLFWPQAGATDVRSSVDRILAEALQRPSDMFLKDLQMLQANLSGPLLQRSAVMRSSVHSLTAKSGNQSLSNC